MKHIKTIQSWVVGFSLIGISITLVIIFPPILFLIMFLMEGKTTFHREAEAGES